MGTWLEDTEQALRNLGGVAALKDIYAEVKRIRPKNLIVSTEATIRKNIETNSSDSSVFGGNDIFFSVEGLGRGIWGLRSMLRSTPEANDINEPNAAPERIEVKTYRILRDTRLARQLKQLHNNRCQICGTTLTLSDGETYSEAHHIQPLGSPYNGRDVAGNILVLCPNCHVLCDYGAKRLDLTQLHTHPNHPIDRVYIDYHNNVIIAD